MHPQSIIKLGDPLSPPRCLLLHGFTGAAADWQAVWPSTIPALAVDLPGHGASPAPQGTMHQWIADWHLALPDRLDTLVGYSLGGRLALSLLAVLPHRWRRLVIISAHPGLNCEHERRVRCQADQVWIECLREQGIVAFVNAWEAQPLFASQRQRVNHSQLASQRQRRLSHHASALAQTLGCFGLGQMPPTWQAIATFQGPLHWIVGTEDTRFVAIAEQVKQHRPATTLHHLSSCGHNPLLEQPEQLHDLLRLVCR